MGRRRAAQAHAQGAPRPAIGEKPRFAALRADADYDRQITFGEIGAYLTRRVPWYLNVAGELAGSSTPYTQNVQIYPAGDPLVLFGRQGQ